MSRWMYSSGGGSSSGFVPVGKGGRSLMSNLGCAGLAGRAGGAGAVSAAGCNEGNIMLIGLKNWFIMEGSRPPVAIEMP